ncbi:MAG TPA: hypothetical protein PLG73_15585 [Candidatus Sumerlaeota bacterium]|nr:hypothetical protein [Candidatus Sumerlaeota bacterium]
MMKNDLTSYLDDDFAHELISLAGQDPPSGPVPYYDPDSDSIILHSMLF